MFASVLFPIDRSRQCADTVATALRLAQQQSSRLLLLSVVDPEDEAMADGARVAALLEQARQPFEQAGLTCQVLERQGKAAFVICDVADEEDVDLIVLGTRGIASPSGSESVAAKVIQLAPCPVLVVP